VVRVAALAARTGLHLSPAGEVTCVLGLAPSDGVRSMAKGVHGETQQYCWSVSWWQRRLISP
jgi:hypothetical protein